MRWRTSKYSEEELQRAQLSVAQHSAGVVHSEVEKPKADPMMDREDPDGDC